MRPLFLLPLAFALSQASAFAAPQAPQSEAAVSDSQVRSVQPTYKPRPAELEELLGVYPMDNGVNFKIATEHRKLYAQLGQRDLGELVPVSENHFLSPDGRVALEVRLIPFATEIVLTYPSEPNVATSELITVRFAGR
jgi:hypothetical protein